jgi:hypothetical protein
VFPEVTGAALAPPALHLALHALPGQATKVLTWAGTNNRFAPLADDAVMDRAAVVAARTLRRVAQRARKQAAALAATVTPQQNHKTVPQATSPASASASHGQPAPQPEGQRVVSLLEAHRIFGHCDLRRVPGLVRATPGLTLRRDARDKDPCLGCSLGKATAARTTKGPHAPRQGPWFAVDLTGVKTPSLQHGFTHAVVITEIDTHFKEVLFVKDRSGTTLAHEFRLWTLRRFPGAEAPPSGATLWIDEDGSLVAGHLRQLVDSYGWKIHKATSADHATHGVAERSIRTLAHHTACYLHDSNLPPSFWAVAMAHACFIWNRMPNPRDGKVPAKLAGLPDHTLHGPLLKPFGCLAAVYDPDASKSDWAPRANLAISLGVDQSSSHGTFILFDLATGRLRRSRAVRHFASVYPEARTDPAYRQHLLAQLRPTVNFTLAHPSVSAYDKDPTDWRHSLTGIPRPFQDGRGGGFITGGTALSPVPAQH